MWVCGALMVCITGYGTFPSHSDDFEPAIYFGLPVAFSASPPLSVFEDGVGIGGSPLLLFQASSVDWLGRHRVEGYGFFRLPTEAGSTSSSEVHQSVLCQLSNIYVY
jgi:hypothetical protein